VTWRFKWASLTSIYPHTFIDNPQIIVATLGQTINQRNSSSVAQNFSTDFASVKGTKIKLVLLKYLSIQEVSFLTVLETPALEELEIEFKESSDNGRTKTDFLLRSNCKLFVLNSSGIDISVPTEILIHAES